MTTGGLDAVAVFQEYLAGNGGIHLTSKVLARLDWVLKLHLTKTGRSWHGYHFQDGRLRFTPNLGAVSPDFEVFALLHAVADFVRRCPRCAAVFLAEGRRRYCSSLCAVTDGGRSDERGVASGDPLLPGTGNFAHIRHVLVGSRRPDEGNGTARRSTEPAIGPCASESDGAPAWLRAARLRVL